MLPLVYLTMETRNNLSIVTIDNYLGGRMAMSHLLKQGYRKIAHIVAPRIGGEHVSEWRPGEML